MSVEKSLAAIEALLLDMRKRIEGLEEKLKPEPTCFTYPEAAQRLGIGLTKLKRMVKRGEIRKSYLGENTLPLISLSEIRRVSLPEAEQPKHEAKVRAEAWTPIKRKRG